MDWTKAIAINQAALARIIGEIATMLEWALTGMDGRLPRVLHSGVLRQLRPAEAALRRLIVMLARDVAVKLPAPRLMPKGLKIKRKTGGPLVFRLYDQRKRLSLGGACPRTRARPRITFFAPSPLVPLAQPRGKQTDGAVNATQLGRRLEALQTALETLPQQARRMARWRLRREAQAAPKFTSPLRPGQPPGHVRKPRFKVDHVLAACHGLAFEALALPPRLSNSS
jgi:hypothetical protein